MRYQIDFRLSEHISVTPEGYLLCLDAPIARTGVQLYAPDEVPFEVEGDGPVQIMRPEDEVFAPLTIASFEGKPATLNHPDEDVTPATWRELAVGHSQNVRRGEGVEADLLLADLLITEDEAIGAVLGGLREISCGYDADYELGEDGVWVQRNIRGNHVALVRRGRCGPRCMINDNREDDMKKPTFKDRMAALKKGFAKLLDEAMAESDDPSAKKPDKPGGGEGGAADDATEERLAALEAKMEEISITLRQLAKAEEAESQDGEGDPEAGVEDEDGAGEGEEKKPEPGKTGDRAKARDARTVDADVKARAQMLVPGFRVDDTDKRCVVQRAALRQAMKDKAIDGLVTATLRGSTLDSCDCVTLDAAFVAASELARATHNRRTSDGLAAAKDQDFGAPTTPAAINIANRKYHDKTRGK